MPKTPKDRRRVVKLKLPPISMVEGSEPTDEVIIECSEGQRYLVKRGRENEIVIRPMPLQKRGAVLGLCVIPRDSLHISIKTEYFD